MATGKRQIRRIVRRGETLEWLWHCTDMLFCTRSLQFFVAEVWKCRYS